MKGHHAGLGPRSTGDGFLGTSPFEDGEITVGAGLFDSVFHEVDEAIAILAANDDRPLVVDVNAQFERQTGFSRREIRGNDLFSLLPAAEETGYALATLRQALSERKSAVIETRILRKGDAAVPVQLTVRPYRLPDGSNQLSSQFVCVMRTTQPEGRGEDQAARVITNRLLTFLSHDLRTPLNGILGFSEIMMTGFIGPLEADDYRAYAKDIHVAGQDLLRLINGLLDLSHSETGRLQLCDSIFSLSNCLDACLDATRERAVKSGVTLSRSIARNLPAFRGDETRIRQVILIMLANALKYTLPGGRITLTMRSKAGGVEICCKDDGVGIAGNELVCAFQPYRKIEDTYTNPRAGIGVGLPLVKVLIEQHGGSVAITSTEGSGTCITLRLPPERLL
nr:PAS domain-containing sensor histidine kinase [Govania unica]